MVFVVDDLTQSDWIEALCAVLRGDLFFDVVRIHKYGGWSRRCWWKPRSWCSDETQPIHELGEEVHGAMPDSSYGRLVHGGRLE